MFRFKGNAGWKKNLASFNLGMREALVLGDRDFLQKLKSDSVHNMNK